MTRLFNAPEAFVTEALEGFALAHRDRIQRIDGGVVRSSGVGPGSVAVVIGGGSGHYPAFAGLVGPGLAAGAVCGNLFSSPSSAQVVRVARAVDAGAGVLFSFGNYAGDVMHFGLAAEQLAAAGIESRTVLVTDDIASAPVVEERRGIGAVASSVSRRRRGARSTASNGSTSRRSPPRSTRSARPTCSSSTASCRQ